MQHCSAPRTILVLHRGGAQLRGSEEALLTFLAGIDRNVLRPVVWYSNPILREPVSSLGIEGRQFEFPQLLVTLRRAELPVWEFTRSFLELRRSGRDRAVDAILCNGGLPCQLAVPVGRLLGVPVVCLFHHPAPALYHRWWLTKHTDAMVYVSEFTAADTRTKIRRTDGDVVYVGIDTSRFTPVVNRGMEFRRSLGYAEQNIVFSQVGALVSHKGHDILLQAFAIASRALPTARLLIIGDGPERARLEALAGALDVTSQVTFTGYVPDLLPYYQHVVDVNVLASREEGLGLVNVQASACGLPNLSTDATGIREGVLHGRTGFLFPVGDSTALADLMLRLAADPVLRARLGDEGRQFAVARFSTTTYIERIAGVIQYAIARRAAR